MKPQIKINGKTVQNMDQVPDIVKGMLVDQDNNGLPDVADNALKMAGGGVFNQVLLNIAGKNMANLSDEDKRIIGEKIAKFSKLAGGNANLQSLISTFMNGQNGKMNISTEHPTVTVSTSAQATTMNPVQNDKTTSINNQMNNLIPTNMSIKTKKTPATTARIEQKQNQKYFQSTPLNPLGGVNSLITPATGKGGGAIFFVAFALVVGWGIYELSKNGMLEKILDALK